MADLTQAQQAAIDAATRRLQGSRTGMTPAQQAAIDAARARTSGSAAPSPSSVSNEGLVIPSIGTPETTYENRPSLTRQMSADTFNTSGSALLGAFGRGPSVAAEHLPEAIPEGPFRNALGRTLDLPLAALTGVGGVYYAGAGAVGDAARGVGAPYQTAKNLSRDLAAMPEAFAGSVGGARNPMAAEARAGERTFDRRALQIQREFDRVDTLSARAAPLANAEGMARALGQASRSERRIERLTPTIAAAAEIDRGAMNAAERLKMDLPPDVFARSQELRQQIGMNRSQVASPAATAWRETLIKSLSRADEAIAELNVATDISSVSDRTLRSLRATRDQLNFRAGAIYDQVRTEVPPASQVTPDRTLATINSALSDLGGNLSALSAEERSLLNFVSSGRVTYEGLARIKRDIGRAVHRGDGPYGNADQALLNRLYGSIAEDQLAAVGRIAGEEAAANLRTANGLYAQSKTLEGQIVDAFGRGFEGGVAPQIRGAVTGAARGDVKGLNEVLNVIPADLRRDAIVSGIVSATRSRASGLNMGPDQPFGMAQFVQFYGGLRSNSVPFNRIRKEIGPEASQVMDDLYTVGKYLQDARANVLTTGKANQQVLNNLAAEGLLTRAINTTSGRAVVRGAGAGLGGLIGNIPGAMAGAAATDIAISARVDPRIRLGNMITSPRFQQLLAEGATTGRFNPATIQAAAADPRFRRWAQSVRIKDPHVWLTDAVAALAAGQGTEPQGGLISARDSNRD